MRRIWPVAAASAAALLLAAPLSFAESGLPGGASPNTGFLNGGDQGLRICTSGSPDQGSGQFVVEGQYADAVSTPAYAITPVLNPAGDATDLNSRCYDIPARPGQYRVTPGKYLSASCLETDRTGDVVYDRHNPDSIGYTDERCQGKVHHWHTQHDRLGDPSPLSTIEVPEVVITVREGEVSYLSAHIVDVRYPECTESSSGPSENRVCYTTGLPHDHVGPYEP